MINRRVYSTAHWHDCWNYAGYGQHLDTAADLDNDKVWDVWRLEGPTWVSYFRGAPHVHAYINVGLKNV